jgi:hypothetical protein
MSPQHLKTYRQSGASLVAVLWLIGFLGLAILGAAKFVTLDTSWATKVKKRAEAKNLAETGLALGTHPRVKSGDPLLRSFDPETETGYEVRITSEEGLIPLNQVLLSGRKDCLKRLFEIWGQDPDEAASLVDAMRDWIDADGLASLNGAESPAYDAAGRSGFPFNRPFASLGEVDLVIGCGGLVSMALERAAQLGVEVVAASTTDEAALEATSRVRSSDAVLVKGSRSVGAEKVVQALSEAWPIAEKSARSRAT